MLSRVVRSRRASSKSRQNGGAGGHHGGSLKNGNSFHSIEDCIQEDSETYPPEVTDKYHIKQVKTNDNPTYSIAPDEEEWGENSLNPSQDIDFAIRYLTY